MQSAETLLDLANTTVDRTLSQYALIAAAHCCSAGIQQKIANLVSIPEARWIRLDAIDALADADSIDPWDCRASETCASAEVAANPCGASGSSRRRPCSRGKCP
ncbi:hypothetical protein [Mesorhizobium escarrei]|uniref:hypothetical protein n=1 Tax=Mesorhizobium escarrei TaxID=666018 RepID=UPI0020A7290B|nr:hypothetical protein [Mesorhizobium escarrei]